MVNLVILVLVILSGTRTRTKYLTYDGGGDIFDKGVEDYLTRYGYLPQSDLETGNLRTMDQLEDAVRNLQGFAGLKMTGRFDKETAALVSSPRCGVQDVALGFRNKREVGIRVKRYNLQGQRWSHNNLTWALIHHPEGGPSRDIVRRELYMAFSVWSSHTKLTFTELHQDDPTADIKISFVSHYHGDGYPFDGAGSVLAHAFFPGSGRGGDVHFDQDEAWSELRQIDRYTTSLFAVAVHEFGHSLGLSHSGDRSSLMFPWYSVIPTDNNLPKDDITAIQHLYGPPDEQQNEILPSSPTRLHTTTTTTIFSSSTTTNTIDYDMTPDKCDTNFDAVAILRSEMWVFKGRYFWRINKEGGSREDPMELSSFWYGLPSEVDHVDAVYERNDHNIVFFIGNKFYILASNTQQRTGARPLTDLGLPSSLTRIDGAMRWGYNDKTYFFSGTTYWRFDEDTQSVELDYPRDMVMWKGVPYNIDAVFQYTDKKTYFFKQKKVWEFDDSYMKVTKDSPRMVGEVWLNCPKEIQDPYNPAGSTISSTTSHKPLHCLLFNVLLATTLISYFHSYE